MRSHVTRVDSYALDVPRRRDGSLNPGQGQVFVWEGEDEMCSMMQTRVKARGSDPKMWFSTIWKGSCDCDVYWHIFKERL